MDRGWDFIVPGWSLLYHIRPPLMRDQPVGGVGGFYIVRGGISPGDNRVRSQVVGVVYVWMNYNPGMGHCRPQMTVTLSTIPGQ